MTFGRTPEEVEAHAIAREETYERFDDMTSQEAKDFYAEVLAEVLGETPPPEAVDPPTTTDPTKPEWGEVDFGEVEDLPEDGETLEEMVVEGDIG